MNLVVLAAGAEVVFGGGDDGLTQGFRQGSEGDGRDDVIRQVRTGLVQPVADVLGAVVGHDQAGVTDGAHILAQFVEDLEGDHLALRVQPFQNMTGNDAVTRPQLNDHPRSIEVDAVNRRLAQSRAAAGDGAGGAKVADALEEEGKGGQEDKG